MTALRALDENLAHHLALCDTPALLVHLHALARELDARGEIYTARLVTQAQEVLAQPVRWRPGPWT